MATKIRKGLILFLLIFPLVSLANGLVPCKGLDCTPCHLLKLVQNVIDFIIKLSFLICIVLIVYGGFRWLLSFGKEENITAAQKIIVSTLFGLLIVLTSWLIVHTIFWLLAPKIEGIDNLNSTWFKLECY